MSVPSTLRLLPLMAAWIFSSAQAQLPDDPMIPFTPAQLKSLDIRLVRPQASRQIIGQTLPARVIAAPDAEWVITAPASGVVVRLPVSEGEIVARGAVLAELRSAEVPQLGSELLQAESAARLAQSELDRDRQLHADGIIATRRLQSSEQAAAQASSQLSALRMRLKLMGMNAEDARNGQVMARAPSDATVLERMATPGQRVDQADALLRLADPNRLMLELMVPADDAAFATGEKLVLPDGRQAKVTQAGWGLSGSTQTVRLRALIPESQTDSGLRPGQWIKVQRSATAAVPVWVVPNSAISRLDQDSVVFVQQPEGFKAVPVKILASDASTSTVSGALRAQAAIASSATIAIKGAWLGHGGSE